MPEFSYQMRHLGLKINIFFFYVKEKKEQCQRQRYIGLSKTSPEKLTFKNQIRWRFKILRQCKLKVKIVKTILKELIKYTEFQEVA